MQKAYAQSGLSNESYPVTEKAAGEILSLPMFPGLTPGQIEYISTKIQEFITAQ